MTDKELFLKYNLVPTNNQVKSEKQEIQLYNNEITYNEPSVHKKVLLLLHASYQCNLNCIYCENGALRKEYHNAVMSEQMVRDIVRKLGPYLREVTWHGGEPLVSPEDLIYALEEEKKKFGYNFDTTLQTNSVLLTDEKIKFLDDLGIQWGTSFDGITNDISRGTKSTEAILDLIKRHPNRVGFINVTIKDTINDLIKNYEYYKSLDVTSMQQCIVRENVIDETNPYLVNNNEAVEKMLEYINYWIHDTNSPIRDSYVIRQICRLIGDTHLCEDSYCLGGWLIIDPLGNICCCGQSGIHDGFININDIDIYKDILNNKKYLSMLNKQRKLVKTCSDCTWYRVCYGACMGLNYECDHSYQTISPRNCEYNHRLLDGIYELIKDIDVTRRDVYNPIFLQLLEENCYYSLTEIKEIEERLSNG